MKTKTHNQLRNDHPAKTRWVGLAIARPFAGRSNVCFGVVAEAPLA